MSVNYSLIVTIVQHIIVMSNCWKHKFDYFICFVCLPVGLPGIQNSGDTSVLLVAIFFFFFALFPHTFFFHNGKMKDGEAGGGWEFGRRAELDDLVTIRGHLRHTETETSRQLANLHRLVRLASTVSRKENGSRMLAAWYLTLQYTSVHRYSG